jgi:outer membrane protein assembly factor BamB
MLLALTGCSTIGGWFGSGEPKLKPAELTEIKPTASLSRVWEANVGGAGGFQFAPASDGQAVYAAGRDGRIVKLDLATGREMWRVETGRTLSAGVGFGADLVLVGTPKGELLAYRASDGQSAWSAQLSGEILAAPVAGAGVVAARGSDGKVWLFNAADGKQRWVYSRSLPSLTLREPAGLRMSDKALYAGHAGGRLTALSLANGAPLWEANVALPKGVTELERIADVTGALALDERIVCAAAYQGRVSCFDRISGNLGWSRDFSALRGLDLDNRHVYAVDDRGAVQAFELRRGTSPWKQDKLRDRRLSTPLAQGDYLAVGDYQGYVHLLDADTGAFAARAASDGSAITAPMLPLNKGLVVQTSNGGVYAFRIGEK